MMEWLVNEGTCPVYGEMSGNILIDEMLYGMAVEILEDHGAWVKVKTEYDYYGYCMKEFLVKKNHETDSFIISSFIDAMDQAKYSSRIIKSLPRGSKLRIIANVDDWFKVLLSDDSEAYVRKEHVMEFSKYLKTDEDEIREQIVELGKLYLGTQYRWGGKSSLGIDCSGLASIVYLLNGLKIFRDAEIKEEFGMKNIHFEKMKLGDLIYFPGHVAIYIGDNDYLHATGASAGVTINSFDKSKDSFREDLKDNIIGCATVFGG
ncbi:MAG: C40 family peptidase [Clostridiales bacterium]|nr:C40 family peptidase [Clostridiales bacterium]